MCGIAGIFNLTDRPVERGTLERMNDLLSHRGPDDEGYYVNGALGLAHKRLAIIDLSPEAHQPMRNEEGNLWIVYNGEVFNYIELMDTLKGMGHVFRSRSDTEVVLHAFEEWGPGCLNRLNGMWAFAIWDERNKQLFCSRDRFGIKPFYYVYDGARFVFASEIKALFADRSIPKIPRERTIYRYLAKGYGYVDTNEETFFSGVKQLAPGHCLSVSRERMECTRYWQLGAGDARGAVRKEDVAERFLSLLQDSVRLCMRSDVPLGLSLSGGLDSASLAAVMARLSAHKVESFSACFEEEGFNERMYIDEVVANAKLTPNFIFPRASSLTRELEKIIWHQDEPYSGASVFSQWEVMKRAKEKGIKVLLTGQGGDEALAGYNKYYPYLFVDLVKSARIGAFLGNLSHLSPRHGYTKQEALHSMGRIMASRMLPRAVKLCAKRRLQARPRFLSADFASRARDEEKAHVREMNSFLDQELYDSITISPLPGLLHIDDRNSMAHSIESRPPFLDHRLVEFLFSLPYHAKISRGYTKYILREALNGLIPEKVRLRRDKMGFVTPAAVWFRNEMRDFIVDILHSGSLRKRGIFDVRGVDEVLDLHTSGRADYSFTVWSWVNLELWFRVCVDGVRDAHEG